MQDGSGKPVEAAKARFARSSVGMLMTDPSRDDNPIVYVNDAFERTTGYTRNTAIGRNARFLQGDDTEPDVRETIRRAIAEDQDAVVDITNYRADGSAFVNRLTISPVRDGDGGPAYWVGLVMERNAGQDVESLDAQLREIQHRVKNHLSMIISMIRMEARQSADKTAFAALARRVESLQLLYEEMEHADETRGDDRVPLGSYLSRIATAVSHLDGRPGLRVNVSVDEIEAPIQVATQMGLVLSEVLTNAFQHAFEGREQGLVEVEATRLGQSGLRLRVSDDGIGIPGDAEWPKPGSLGGRIMAGIVQSLSGRMDISRGQAGTTVTIDVPDIAPDAG